MVGRWEPPRRRYTELCNRSSSPGSPVPRPFCPPACDEGLEDHWEDSSVSIRPSRSWDPSSSAWLHAASFSPGSCDGLVSCDRVPSRSRPSRYSFDAGEHSGSACKGRRCFPPPMSSCCTLSIKEGGRFVLKEMDDDRPHGFLRAQRENGRLLLQFVLPEESSDEVAALEGDVNKVSVVDDGVISKDEDKASAVERLGGSVAGTSGGAFTFQDAQQHLYADGRTGNSDCLCVGEDVTSINGGDVLAETPKEIEWEYALPQCEGFCNGLEDPTVKPSDETAFLARQDACKEDGARLSGAIDGGQIAAENAPGLDQQHVAVLREPDRLWDVDVAGHILPSLSSCSPNQIYLHPPLIPTVCGLAMS